MSVLRQSLPDTVKSQLIIFSRCSLVLLVFMLQCLIFYFHFILFLNTIKTTKSEEIVIQVNSSLLN